MLRDETRGLLQEAHSIRRNESPAPLGLLFSITNSKHPRAISISPACWHDASSCPAERPLSGSPAVHAGSASRSVPRKVDSGPLGGPDGDDSGRVVPFGQHLQRRGVTRLSGYNSILLLMSRRPASLRPLFGRRGPGVRIGQGRGFDLRLGHRPARF